MEDVVINAESTLVTPKREQIVDEEAIFKKLNTITKNQTINAKVSYIYIYL